MNRELKMALVLDERPAWRIAIEAGISPTKLSRIVAGLREARPEERTALARVLRTSERKLFSSNAPRKSPKAVTARD